MKNCLDAEAKISIIPLEQPQIDDQRASPVSLVTLIYFLNKKTFHTYMWIYIFSRMKYKDHKL